ncbi:hypothetical protein FQN57_005678 [Myotisia sp. PD_48]|nr:hypothetical protein FQN57_005678 [Myotisia sp. PD_48]
MATILPYRDINLLACPQYYAFKSASSSSALSLVVDRPTGDMRLASPSTHAAKRISSVSGILGIVKLKLDKYIIVISKARPMGRLRGHMVYKVVSTELLPLRERPLHDPDEDNYLLMLKRLLHTGPMYFSYSLDITNSFQRQSQSDPSLPLWKRADDRFYWNRFIQTDLIDFRSSLSETSSIRHGVAANVDPFILPVIFGMLRITTTSVKSTPFTFALITRRSRYRAGTRYFSRGINEHGHVSNYNETEQIVILNDTPEMSGFGGGMQTTKEKNYQDLQVMSFVQTRGSIPVYWAEVNNLKYTPKLTVRPVDIAVSAAQKHFSEQIRIYGENYLVNLVNQKGREEKMKNAYEQIVRHLLSSSAETTEADRRTTEKIHAIEATTKVQEMDRLHYVYFDFHNETKGLKWHRAELLLNDLKDGLQKGNYFSGSESPGNPSGNLDIRLLQSSVVRTNCMDCLDRTNVVQSMLARWSLTRQLQDAGALRPGEKADDDLAFRDLFRNIWADNADVVSRSYSGTGALKTDFTRTGERTKAGMLQDGSNSATRYIRNNFMDGPRQDGFDLFHGVYLPPNTAAKTSVFTDRRPLIIQAIPYILGAAVFMLLMATFSRQLPDRAAWPLRLFLIFWFIVAGWCLRFIHSHGMLYVNWPKLNTPTAAAEGYTDALRRAGNNKLIGEFIPTTRHQRGDAIAALNTIQSNFTSVETFRKNAHILYQQSLPETLEWFQKLGYKPSDFDKLNLIHIAGTKGKGSTCAFISSILAQYLDSTNGSTTTSKSDSGPKLHKIGLYTSPHLRFVRERIQINNAPLSEAQFAKYFFEVWDRLEEVARVNGAVDPTSPDVKPSYFRFLTLMAFHTYMREGVDAAIIECGIGGEYDTTNIIANPVVEGISSLGIDHVIMLGSTIEEIAWHKGGIIKPRSVAYTATQPEGAIKVLRERAAEKNAELDIAIGHPGLTPGKLTLGLSGEFQYRNAELAVAICSTFLSKLGFSGIPSYADKEPLTKEFTTGLEKAALGGRCEIRKEKNLIWHIDGGHTPESIELAAKWFLTKVQSRAGPKDSEDSKPRILIFNQQARDSIPLIRSLHSVLSESGYPFTHAIFCTNVTFREAGYRPDLVSINSDSRDVQNLSVQHTLADAWKEFAPDTKVEVKATIEEAVESARAIAASVVSGEDSLNEPAITALVTGSLHLVGGLLEVLETKT